MSTIYSVRDPNNPGKFRLMERNGRTETVIADGLTIQEIKDRLTNKQVQPAVLPPTYNELPRDRRVAGTEYHYNNGWLTNIGSSEYRKNGMIVTATARNLGRCWNEYTRTVKGAADMQMALTALAECLGEQPGALAQSAPGEWSYSYTVDSSD